jgi:hypothetical protein
MLQEIGKPMQDHQYFACKSHAESSLPDELFVRIAGKIECFFLVL